MRGAVIFVMCLAVSSPVFAALSSPPPGYLVTTATAGISSSFTTAFSQLTFKPGDTTHLYASRGFDKLVTRFNYDPITAKLSNPVNVLDLTSVPDNMGVITGIGFNGNDMWVTRWPGWTSPRPGALSRFRDTNSDGIFDSHTDFVTGIELGQHTFNEIQIVGNSLYTGIGKQTNSGNPTKEDIYNGTIVRLGDLNNPVVENLTNSADRTAFQNSSVVDGRLRYYAGGFRNPYGIRVKSGEVWVADNGADAQTGFAETPDLLYRNVKLNDLGHFPPAPDPGAPVPTVDPIATIGSHKAPAGFDFIPSGPDRNKALVGLSAETTNGKRLVTVDPANGAVTDFITGMDTPTDVIQDSAGHLLVCDYILNSIYAIWPPPDGDANLDRKVDMMDLYALAQHWQQPGNWAGGDFDGNGFVNAHDLGLLALNWQNGVNGSLSQAIEELGLPLPVPEPGGFLLVAVSVVLLKRRVRYSSSRTV